jgi:hypothetical protein
MSGSEQATKSDAEFFAERGAHARSLFDLDAKYADVIGLDDALSYLDKLGHNSAT